MMPSKTVKFFKNQNNNNKSFIYETFCVELRSEFDKE